jgi:hypothetical protein
MPVVLGPEMWPAWLGEEPADARSEFLTDIGREARYIYIYIEICGCTSIRRLTTTL